MNMKVSILSQRAAGRDQQIKAGGKIRPGIKVLTNAAKANAKAVDLYNQGVLNRLKFSEIEKQIVEACNIKNPMYPRNTPYYNVAASDFGMPELAAMIVEKYGEVRHGDSEKRLYRFPVVFHSGDVGDIYPNQFRRYGGEPGYESHYGEDGKRYCRYLPEVTKEMVAEQQARRIKRPPRRDKVIRGECEPRSCPEFLQGQCKFRGTLHFYIPGVPTTGLMVMETTSEYAAEAIWSDLDRIQQALGHIPRTNPNNPGKPIFWITKVQEIRTYFDENGQKKSGVQWVPKLQADIDMGSLLSSGANLALQHKPSPVAWLAAPKAMPEASILVPTAPVDMPPIDIPSTPAAVASSSVAPTQHQATAAAGDPVEAVLQKLDMLGLEHEETVPYFDLKFGEGWEDRTESLAAVLKQLDDFSKVGGACARLLIEMTLLAHQIDVPPQDFMRYATGRHGRGITGNETVLNQVVTELRELAKSGPQFAKSYIYDELKLIEQRVA
jgi:hypothetical protein